MLILVKFFGNKVTTCKLHSTYLLLVNYLKQIYHILYISIIYARCIIIDKWIDKKIVSVAN